MKIIYLSFLNELVRPGYRNKIHSQVKAFYDLGCEAYLYTVSGEKFILYNIDKHEQIIREYEVKHKRKKEQKNLYDEMFFMREYVDSAKKLVEEVKPDLVYIRRIVPITPWILNLISYLRDKDIYVAYEYPTYPWKKEMIVTGKKIFYYIDALLYKSLYKRIDQLVCFGEYDGESNKVVETMNGVDVGIFPVHCNMKKEKQLNIIAIGHIMPQHGYDKLIRGLERYYSVSDNDWKIYLNIVGTEGKGVDLRLLAKKCNVEKFVKFHGFKKGLELDEVFDDSDMGVDCLALNRIETDNLVGSLKSREYLARGIPFIYAGNLDFIRRYSLKTDYILEVDEKLDYVDFNQVIEFYVNVKSSPEEIRSYAKEKLSWTSMMKKVLDKYREDIGYGK